MIYIFVYSTYYTYCKKNIYIIINYNLYINNSHGRLIVGTPNMVTLNFL